MTMRRTSRAPRNPSLPPRGTCTGAAHGTDPRAFLAHVTNRLLTQSTLVPAVQHSAAQCGAVSTQTPQLGGGFPNRLLVRR